MLPPDAQTLSKRFTHHHAQIHTAFARDPVCHFQIFRRQGQRRASVPQSWLIHRDTLSYHSLTDNSVPFKQNFFTFHLNNLHPPPHSHPHPPLLHLVQKSRPPPICGRLTTPGHFLEALPGQSWAHSRPKRCGGRRCHLTRPGSFSDFPPICSARGARSLLLQSYASRSTARLHPGAPVRHPKMASHFHAVISVPAQSVQSVPPDLPPVPCAKPHTAPPRPVRSSGRPSSSCRTGTEYGFEFPAYYTGPAA